MIPKTTARKSRHGPELAGQILLSSRTASAVEDLIEAEEVGSLTLKGLQKPVPAVNVTGLKASP